MRAESGALQNKQTATTGGGGLRPFKDLLLYLSVYPETSSEVEVAEAVKLCGSLAAHVCAAVEEPNFDVRVNPWPRTSAACSPWRRIRTGGRPRRERKCWRASRRRRSKCR